MTGNLSFYHLKSDAYWAGKCSGYDMHEEKGCIANCKRCQVVPSARLFVSSFLGCNGHNSGTKS